MRTPLVNLALTGALGLGLGALVVPGVAAAADPAAGQTRVGAFTDALQGLVTDGTLTQAQADEVATTLDQELPARGPHGRGHGGGGAGVGPAELAAATGATPEDLRTALKAGQTLAQVAAGNGISQADLVASLVKAARAHLAEEVAEGDLTQAEADAKGSDLQERLTARVDEAGGGRGPGRHHGPGPDEDEQD